MNYLPGDIFLTRSIGVNEADNPSPGHFNHTAIYYGDDKIIESQQGYGVVYSHLYKFQNRYPVYAVLRYNNAEMAKQAASVASVMVGTSYRKIASIFRFLRNSRRGENCVSLVRKCYMAVLDSDPGWKFPDHIWSDNRFRTIEIKEYDDWMAPPPMDGIIPN